jgi:hypothetical protein
MKKNNFTGNRVLKNNLMEIKPGNIGLNPLTLTLFENTSNSVSYFSKFHFDNDKLITITKDKKLQISNNTMSTPTILIQQNDFLKIHQIHNINDLLEYINNNSDNLFDYNNRLVNCFIRSNFKDLSKNNKILSNIFLKLFKNYKIDVKEINKFIDDWFKNNNGNEFSLNLGNDLENYLSKKYES